MANQDRHKKLYKLLNQYEQLSLETASIELGYKNAGSLRTQISKRLKGFVIIKNGDWHTQASFKDLSEEYFLDLITQSAVRAESPTLNIHPFQFKNGSINVSESCQYEFKTACHIDNLIKNLAAFSNSPGGGYLFYGIEDQTGRVIGLNKDDPFNQDVEKLSGLVRQQIHPFPSYKKDLQTYDGKTVGIIQINEGSPLQKPFFVQNTNDYNVKYRYNGQTCNIRKAEFERIIAERVSAELSRMASAFASGQSPLIMDASKATLSGPNVIYNVDSKLLDQIAEGKQLIDEGTFREGGLPTLKLVGSIQATPSTIVKHRNIDESVILDLFYNNNRVSIDNEVLSDFLIRTNRVEKIPVYFLFSADLINAIKLKLETAAISSKNRVNKQIDRYNEKCEISFSIPRMSSEQIASVLSLEDPPEEDFMKAVFASKNDGTLDWKSLFNKAAKLYVIGSQKISFAQRGDRQKDSWRNLTCLLDKRLFSH